MFSAIVDAAAPPTAQAIADFLSAHPNYLTDYFTHHGTDELATALNVLAQQRPDLFAELTLPTPPQGVASLPHAQMRIWRERLNRLNRTFETLHATAEANAALDRVLHHFACALLREPKRTAEHVVALLHQHFAVDTAKLIALDTLTPPARQALEGWLASHTPLCGRLNEAQRHALFGAELPDTGSAALIAIGHATEQPGWILALGRITPDGFNPSQGTVFLTQIGELVSAYLSCKPTPDA
jgi:uncharacterized protein YigA (DUF484 family)